MADKVKRNREAASLNGRAREPFDLEMEDVPQRNPRNSLACSLRPLVQK
jgi:hypothetical protein